MVTMTDQTDNPVLSDNSTVSPAPSNPQNNTSPSSVATKFKSWLKALNKKQAALFVIALAVIGVGAYLGMFNRLSIDLKKQTAITQLPSQIKFELTAQKLKGDLIDPTTAFTLTSSQGLSTDEVAQALHVTPQTAMGVKKKSGNVFILTPKEPLQENMGYRFEIAQASADQALPQVLGRFNFQTDGTFRLTESTPANRTTDIGLDTAIELVFSHENFGDYQKYITFEPAIEGRFEKRFNSVVFLPKKLNPLTIYTVKIAKGLGVTGSDKKLEQDQIIQFQTKSTQENNAQRLVMAANWTEFSPQMAPILSSTAYENKGNADLNIKVYKFNSSDDFARSWLASKKYPQWAVSANREIKPDLARASEFRQLTIPLVYDQKRYRNFAIFPEALPEGQYVFEVSSPQYSQPDYVWSQVSPLAAYMSIARNNMFVWVQDVVAKQPAVSASVDIYGEKSLSATNGEGLSLSETPDGIYVKADPQANSRSGLNDSVANKLLKVQKGSSLLFLQTNPSSNSNYYNGESYNRTIGLGDYYWKYANTDKPIYRAGDTINFWGTVKPREQYQTKSLKELKVSLSDYSSQYTGFGNWVEYTSSIKVAVDKNQNFQGSMMLPSLQAGSYYLVFSDPATKEKVFEKFIEVASYVKPVMTIDASAKRKAIIVGDKNQISGEVKFFDGTPLANGDMTYGPCFADDSNIPKSSIVKTNESGQFNVELQPGLQKSWSEAKFHGVSPDHCYFRIAPKFSAEGENVGGDEFLVFPSRYVMDKAYDYSSSESKKITYKLFNVDLNKTVSDVVMSEQTYKGQPAGNVNINYTVYNVVTEKTENGDYYDPITKTTQKTYSYNTKKVELNSGTGTTDASGNFTLELKPAAGETYDVLAYIADPEGRQVQDESYVWGGGVDNDSYQSLQLGVNHANKSGDARFLYGFDLNETGQVFLERGNGPFVPEKPGRLLIRTALMGNQSVKISDQPRQDFTYTESMAPNISIKGVWFNGENFQETWPSNLSLITDPFKLALNFTTNKNVYGPGDQAEVKLKVQTAQGENQSGTFFVAIIDKALLAVRQYATSVLSGIYSSLPSGVLSSYSSHQYANAMDGGGGGGCFTPDTLITMADGSTKPISQIRVGDLVLNQASMKAEVGTAKVNDVMKTKVDEYLVINDQLKVTPEHIVLVNGTWKLAEDIQVGDILTQTNGLLVPVTNILRKFETTDVYNLDVGSVHTYFADGFLVHNQKGERENFKDVAFFGPVEVGNNGEGTLKFKLPDDLTTWAIFGEGVTNDKLPKAGDGQSELLVTQPMAVHMTLAQRYLTGDEPKLMVQAFGKELKENDNVSFSLTAPSLGIKDPIKIEGKAYKPVYFNLPKLTLGTHKITLEGKSGKLGDKVTRPILVEGSRAARPTTQVMPLEKNKSLAWPEAKDTVQTVFTDTGRAAALDILSELQYTWYDRVDSRVARYVSYKWTDTSAEKKPVTDLVTNYQFDNGISLLNKSSESLYYSWLVSLVEPEAFDQVRLKNYFQTLLRKGGLTRNENVLATGGLLVLGAPVQAQFNEIARSNDLDNTDLMEAGLSALMAGNTQLAKELFGKIKDEGIASDLGGLLDDTAKGEGARRSWLQAALAQGVDSQAGSQLLEKARRAQTTTTLVDLEKALYAKISLQKQRQPASATVVVRGETQELKFDGSKPSATFMLQPDELKAVQVQSVNGPVSVVVTANTAIQPEKTSNLVSIQKSINGAVVGKSSINVKSGEIVTIALQARLNKDFGKGCVQVTDYVPAGLVPLTQAIAFANGGSYAKGIYYPYSTDNNKLSFCLSETTQDTIKYQARVLSPGTYQVEPAVIAPIQASGIYNFSTPGTLRIDE